MPPTPARGWRRPSGHSGRSGARRRRSRQKESTMALDVNRPDLTVGVVGTGAMGRGIAQVTAQGGIKAVMYDAAAGGATKAKAGILEVLKGLVAKGRLTDAELAKTEANLGVADRLEDLKA